MEDKAIPSPNPKRDLLLKYLRHAFPYGEDFTAYDGVVYPYEAVKEAVYSQRDNGPELLRILIFHMNTPLSRTRIAEEVGYDPSTVKRKLDIAADNIMQRLVHASLPPEDLFTIRIESTGEIIKTPFPITFQNNW